MRSGGSRPQNHEKAPIVLKAIDHQVVMKWSTEIWLFLLLMHENVFRNAEIHFILWRCVRLHIAH